jgi:hypothetical protein
MLILLLERSCAQQELLHIAREVPAHAARAIERARQRIFRPCGGFMG